MDEFKFGINTKIFAQGQTVKYQSNKVRENKQREGWKLKTNLHGSTEKQRAGASKLGSVISQTQNLTMPRRGSELHTTLL